MSKQILFGFHAVTVRLKSAPKSVIEIHVDATRRDQRMRQFVERAKDSGAKLIDSDDAVVGQDQFAGNGAVQFALRFSSR